MPDSSFQNQIALSEISEGKFVTEAMMIKFRERDIEVMDLMSRFGGPTSTGAGSSVSYEGDVTIAANQNLSGLHYYNNLTINSGVTVTVNHPLIIMARGTVDLSGATLTAAGQGAAGGSSDAAAGADGVAGTGGGGSGSITAGGDGGDCIQFPLISIPGGAASSTYSSPGQNGAAIPSYLKGVILSVADSVAPGGAGGGAGQGASFGQGGNGGGIIIIIAPTVICTGGTISAAGANGGGSSVGAGGGGGGGIIYIKTKSYTPPSVLSVSGGAGGAGSNNGGAGSDGILQIDIFA